MSMVRSIDPSIKKEQKIVNKNPSFNGGVFCFYDIFIIKKKYEKNYKID